MKGDPKKFEAPFIRKEDAWLRADQIRQRYWSSGELPVEVELLLYPLGLELVPHHSIKETGDVDALLLGDLKTIIVDYQDYMNDKMQNRLRFSIAHELGHFVLHQDVFKDIAHVTIKDWIQFIRLIPQAEYSYIEQQAYEFAGRLLVPSDRLGREFRQLIKKAKNAGFLSWDKTGEAALGFIATPISRIFGVSLEVIEKRLRREGFWPIQAMKI
ncbi:MAG: ImmA/IrrE family metallo-endopeptidase [Candidatus Aminicenantes bacterium]|nr:ImmA/IrrE family metallo-endopeptidase [Candidatus Aminicenantes bacterium]